MLQYNIAFDERDTLCPGNRTGTGDIDCVYHAALYELQTAAEYLANEAVSEMLEILVQGKRLRDISDLPLDLTA